ncbi:sugar transferase [Blautia wexlerae]|uniref:Undecaprenyl phosphate N,N'-diacetylbacillosamine 1-phosphate transferase n=2 Tax=Lachnospiraceae TaxID=186803 RepID=A0A564WXH3_9FIRM|nr:sugar transferase [Blautia wexlerae]VUX67171.1 Undecaprenyl phosphate N,N'-diacetylbacillosamine 1-phosphate transferase [Blautia wexlerae]
MSKKKVVGIIASAIVGGTAVATWIMKKKAKKTTYKAESVEAIPTRKMGFYEKYVKRAIDIVCASAAIICFSPLYVGVAILVRFKLGSPVLFTQDRPGLIGEDGKETIFKMYKFRTMTDERDENGDLLPDEVRLTSFGKWLRSTSLDELPEAFNILNGTLSVCGPRPQLVRDLTFMTKEQRMRHTAKPGLSGLAQVNGRNAIKWEDKLDWDLKYIENVSLLEDLGIILKTVKTAFIKQEGITDGDMATAEDFGDYLLNNGKVSQEDYNNKQMEAKKILNQESYVKEDVEVDRERHASFSVAMSVYKSDNPDFFDRALSSITDEQTIIPNEIVLVVDGPVSNEINNVINKYEKKYEIFNVIRLEQNGGLGNALKIAVKNATHELIARMDSDDVSVSTRFEEQLKYFEINPGIDIVGGDITEFIGEENNIVGKRSVPVSNDSIREYMKTRCAMNHVSVMYKKKSVESAGGYQDWFWNEDYYLWIRMWLNGAVFANTGSVLVNVRVGEEMYQRRGGSKYFESEKGLQDYMLKNKMINHSTYIKNVAKRLIIQKLMPNKLRGWVFRTFARKKVS